MRYLNQALLAGGLVILAGPFVVVAQDYVDLEAQRAADAAAPAAAVDPYSARPSQSYPVTTYGASGNAPAGVAVTPAGPRSGGQQPVQNPGALFFQLQQLQQEVMRLSGIVEEQAYELRRLKEQSLERYMELDKRLSADGAGGAVASGTSKPVASAPVVRGTQSRVPEQPGEGEAYRAAYSLVRAQKFEQAVAAFKQFQQNFPGGKYAPNAYYWLGELYLVIQPVDLESSRQAFSLLLSQYPDNSKAPDALYKLGKVQYLKGNPEKAREYMDQVISKYGSTSNAAVKLARDFIAENY